jgi:ketopantoate reductase
LKLLIGGQEKIAKVSASDNPSDFGPQDYVQCTLKAHQSYESASDFTPLLGPNTAIVTAMNGIPWWYFYKEGGTFEKRTLESVDPGGKQWNLLGPERAIGCVVDPACEVIENKKVARQGGPVIDARSTTFRRRMVDWKMSFDQGPELVRKECLGVVIAI